MEHIGSSCMNPFFRSKVALSYQGILKLKDLIKNLPENILSKI